MRQSFILIILLNTARVLSQPSGPFVMGGRELDRLLAEKIED